MKTSNRKVNVIGTICLLSVMITVWLWGPITPVDTVLVTLGMLVALLCFIKLWHIVIERFREDAEARCPCASCVKTRLIRDSKGTQHRCQWCGMDCECEGSQYDCDLCIICNKTDSGRQGHVCILCKTPDCDCGRIFKHCERCLKCKRQRPSYLNTEGHYDQKENNTKERDGC